MRQLNRRWRSTVARRRAGRVMVGVGIVGMLVAVVGSVVGWIFVGDLQSASTESFEVTVQALDAVDDTIDLADDVLGSTADAVDALAGTLTAVSESFDTGTAAIDDVAELSTTIGPSLEEATATIRRLESVGDDIDGVLGALSNIPFGPDYDPSASLGDTFGRLADELEPLPDQLNSTASSLTEFTGSAGTLQAELDTLAESVTSVSADLTETDALVDQYRSSVSDARALALRTGDDLDADVTWLRLLILIGGLNLFVGQIVPLWMGRSLLDDEDPVALAEPAIAVPVADGYIGDDGDTVG